jgi:hypothetical protein
MLPAMRAFVALLALAGLARPTPTDEPLVIRLTVGDQKTELGIMPRCDDLSVVEITKSGRGVRGVKPGSTLCSFDVSGGGARQVWRVVVVEPSATPADVAAGKDGG